LVVDLLIEQTVLLLFLVLLLLLFSFCNVVFL
jgi:hypothetical protein